MQHGVKSGMCALVQLQHSRRGGVSTKLGTARFGGARSLKLSSDAQLAAGSVAAADLEPERLDNQILLDYGVLDQENPQVGRLQCATKVAVT